jgi:ADP-ribose pyrophosphatase YjhB (NUDIX family)
MADLPKGHTEKDESYPDCAIREVTEECGINGMKINSELETTYHSYRLHGERVLKSTHWYLMDYNGDMEGSPQTNEGISALNWMKPDELRLIRNKIWPSLAKLVDFAVKSR